MRLARFLSCCSLPLVLLMALAFQPTRADDEQKTATKPAAAQDDADEADDAAFDDEPADEELAEETEEPANTKKPASDGKGDAEASSDDGERASQSTAARTKGTKKVTFARIRLKEGYPEGPAPEGIFGELQPRLRDAVERLEKAAKDDKLAGVILQIENPEIGLGKLHELRSAIARLRKQNKKVYADLQMATPRDYLLACACDRIVMAESGILMVNGLEVHVTFFKKLLDKLSLKADFIQIGDFKGASEPFTRSSMSPEFRRQFEAVIEDYYQQMVNTIAEDRKLDSGQVKDLIDEGLFTPRRARKAKLIDMVCYEDELREILKKSLGADQIKIDDQYGKKKVDTDFSGLGGFMKLMEAMMGGQQKPKRTTGDRIAIVYAVGVIMPGESESGLFGGETVGCDTIVKALRTAEEDDTVKAIVLRVDSPGGSASASDVIWRQVVRSKKPVVASMGDVAASGGYYISMGADKIIAEPGTLTGSIGVVSGKIAINGLLNKIGVTTEVISRGKTSGAMTPLEPFTPEERAAWLRVSKEIYRQFTSKAAQGRKMNSSKIESVAAGRLFSGRMAAANGLVDRIGTLDDAVAEAKSQAGLKAEDKVELLILPKPKSFLEQLFEGPSVESRVKLVSPEMAGALRTVDTMRRLFSRPGVTVLPYRVEIK